MPPVIIGAAVAGAAGIGAAAISSSAQKKATKKAVAAQQDATAQNNQLQRDIYAKNEAALSGYNVRGNEAGNAINALLGLGGAPVQQPQAQPAFGGMPAISTVGGEPGYSTYGSNAPIETAFNPATGAWEPQPATAAPAQPAANQNYQGAFANYLNSTGYQFRVGEGNKAINTGYAAKGLLESGAAQKALQSYGQNLASDEFGRYIGYLTNQQGVGLSGASALAGVGQGYANSVSANNSNAADAISNAALISGQSTANMYGALAGAIGNVAGAWGSSYKSPTTTTQPAFAPVQSAYFPTFGSGQVINYGR